VFGPPVVVEHPAQIHSGNPLPVRGLAAERDDQTQTEKQKGRLHILKIKSSADNSLKN
jgi:hypothetical protein